MWLVFVAVMLQVQSEMIDPTKKEILHLGTLLKGVWVWSVGI